MCRAEVIGRFHPHISELPTRARASCPQTCMSHTCKDDFGFFSIPHSHPKYKPWNSHSQWGHKDIRLGRLQFCRPLRPKALPPHTWGRRQETERAGENPASLSTPEDEGGGWKEESSMLDHASVQGRCQTLWLGRAQRPLSLCPLKDKCLH